MHIQFRANSICQCNNSNHIPQCNSENMVSFLEVKKTTLIVAFKFKDELSAHYNSSSHAKYWVLFGQSLHYK